uniref:Orcokinin peptides n=1 Tax=Agrotis ipsilon TaxID=56364 RepID=ORCK_AGRIP|nr:RecName: Full=Orcokinin peptides; Contains: RecName: Full=Orcokinin-like peptide; Contains: RecName: Full=Orcokinin-like peptide precursor-related peptide; Short=Orcokinin-like peptide-PP; Flags: Precursor [Agrotis ipsilon]
MRGAGGALAVAVAALLVCCSADPHQEGDVSGSDHNTAERYDAAGQKTRTLDTLGGNLVREVREIRHSGYVPYLISRRFDFASPYGGKREPWPLAPIEFSGYYGDGLPKRNFDEIDRSGLDTFVKKRNFDEIDRSSMPFPYATKRFYHLSSFDKKRYRADYPMDEIDLSHFPIGSKRSQDSYPLLPRNLL